MMGHLSSSVTSGVDLLPFLTGAKTGRPHDHLFWKSRRHSALRKGDWKIIHDRKTDQYEVYDLSADIGESSNLVRANPEKFQQLKTDLETILQEATADQP